MEDEDDAVQRHRAGYPNANYLKNLFKRKTGTSMRDWRRQNGATSQH